MGMHTALDFASRLLYHEALPESLAAELLQRSFTSPSLQTKHMVSLVSFVKRKQRPRRNELVDFLGRADSWHLASTSKDVARASPVPPLPQSQSSRCSAMESRPQPCLPRADT